MLRLLQFSPAPLRRWHIYTGLAVLVPLIVVCVTASLIIHSGQLNFRHMQVDVSALPGYQDAQLSAVRAALITSDGRYFVGTRGGLFELLPDGKFVEAPGVAKNDIRTLRETPAGVFVGGRHGLWQLQGASWKQLYDGDVWSIDALPDKTLRLSDRGKGVFESRDNGAHWQANQRVNQALTQISGKTSMTELMFSLHTGGALFKESHWVWVDVTSFGGIFLALSGLLLWLRSKSARMKHRRFKKVQKAQMAHSTHSKSKV